MNVSVQPHDRCQQDLRINPKSLILVIIYDWLKVLADPTLVSNRNRRYRKDRAGYFFLENLEILL